MAASISAAAVAAHECGHAVQHAKAYAWLGFRSKLVPVVSFSSKWVQWILLGRSIARTDFPGITACRYCFVCPYNIFQLYHSAC